MASATKTEPAAAPKREPSPVWERMHALKMRLQCAHEGKASLRLSPEDVMFCRAAITLCEEHGEDYDEWWA